MTTGGPPRADLPIGSLFADRYQIEAVLGRGGMGAVYRARDVTLRETIALKVLCAGEVACAEEILRFRQEVRLARRVTHPNVARVYDLGEHEGLAFLTMELIDGETLRQALRREGALSPARAARIALSLCEGLRAAHAAGVVHRDLKPANVLLAKDGRVVITDFGIAHSLTDALGLTSGAIGTPSYMAPEQLVSGAVDGRTDIYALGLLLYEMLAGERLAGAIRPGLSPALAALVKQCTAALPDERPASVEEVAKRLAAVVCEDAVTLDEAPQDREEATAAPDLPTRPIQSAPPSRSVARPAPRVPVTVAMDGPALAVLPLRFHGPRDHDHFGDAIADELVDVLARTRGLRVLGTGATSRFRDGRDPRAIGAELGASFVIDGAVQMSGERVRITVRLLEAEAGVQLWSERHDGALGDLFALQEGVAQRVAEELRLEITTLYHRGTAPAEAIELYLTSRTRMRAFDVGEAMAAVTDLERCLDLAPDFAPAIAAHAAACLRRWFIEQSGSPTDWEAKARDSVARALSRAPELAETHLAAGTLAVQHGDYRSAARFIARSLSIAPTYAEAHEYLGALQCEAGQAEEGIRRLRLAMTLDPTLLYTRTFLARQHAFQGDYAAAHAELDALERHHGPAAGMARSLRARLAAWRRDSDALRAFACDAALNNDHSRKMVGLYIRAQAGLVRLPELREQLQRLLAVMPNPRFQSLVQQLAAETYMGLGEIDEARLYLQRAATNVLVDVEWLDRCPLLAPLRGLPDWEELRRRVQARAAAIWRT